MMYPEDDHTKGNQAKAVEGAHDASKIIMRIIIRQELKQNFQFRERGRMVCKVVLERLGSVG